MLGSEVGNAIAHSGYSPALLVDSLIESAEQFDFELGSQVFDYVQRSLVRADRVGGAVDCCYRMIESNVMPSLPHLNVLWDALFRTLWIGAVRELHDAMVAKRRKR